jgi:hypothetical protein
MPLMASTCTNAHSSGAVGVGATTTSRSFCMPVAGSPGYDPSTLFIPLAALASMSEFPRQFWGLKARAMDIVLFMRHGG